MVRPIPTRFFCCSPPTSWNRCHTRISGVRGLHAGIMTCLNRYQSRTLDDLISRIFDRKIFNSLNHLGKEPETRVTNLSAIWTGNASWNLRKVNKILFTWSACYLKRKTPLIEKHPWYGAFCNMRLGSISMTPFLCALPVNSADRKKRISTHINIFTTYRFGHLWLKRQLETVIGPPSLKLYSSRAGAKAVKPRLPVQLLNGNVLTIHW